MNYFVNRSGKRFPALFRQPDALGCIDEIADLSEYAEYLIAITGPDRVKIGDPFHIRTELALMMSLLLYMKQHERKDRQNLSTLYEYLRKGEAGIGDPAAGLDPLFQEAWEKDHDDNGAKVYATYRSGLHQDEYMIQAAERIRTLSERLGLSCETSL